MNNSSAAPLPAPTRRQQLTLSVPVLIVGFLSAVVLWGLERLAGVLEHFLWDTAPEALGTTGAARWWIFLILTLTGMAIGLVVWKVPGHAGDDSATTELAVGAPPLKVLPSLALAAVLMLAGGVSLGPENPIMVINAGLAIAITGKLWPKLPTPLVGAVAGAATIGALFGTPVAAALLFTGLAGAMKGGGVLWDKLFLPLVAAGAGAITMKMLGGGLAPMKLPAYGTPHGIDLLTGSVIATGCALLTLPFIYALPHVHTFFHKLRNPFVYVTLGGIVLGLLGAIGGEITLFKGLHETEELLENLNGWSVGSLIVISLIKLSALLVSASSGFRGGRIFPAVFIGTALGLLSYYLMPQVPVALAVAGGVLGVVLAVARDGWVAIFVAVAIVGDVAVLPVLCIAVLPAWLLVSRSPEMVVHNPVAERWREPEPVVS